MQASGDATGGAFRSQAPQRPAAETAEGSPAEAVKPGTWNLGSDLNRETYGNLWKTMETYGKHMENHGILVEFTEIWTMIYLVDLGS